MEKYTKYMMNRLNINDLNYVITECINLLVENTSVSAAYRKYFSSIPEDKYKELVELDPTYKGGDIMGKYGVWILNQYKKGNIQDINQLRNYLEIFTKFINRIDNKNIQSYKNPEELRSTIQPFLDNPNQATSKSKAKMKVKEGAENVYEDSDWVVIVPKTWEASKFYGANTKWCTTERNSDHYFKYYSKQAPLYIIINKKTKVKYQLHMPDSHNWQFKDAEDREVRVPCSYIGLSDGIIDFFNGLSNDEFGKIYLKLFKKDLGEGMAWIKSKEGSFLIGNGKKIKIENYKEIKPFKEGFACVQNDDGKWNFINTEGKLLSDIWWSESEDFKNGIAKVKNYNKSTSITIDRNGNIISVFKDGSKWFRGKQESYILINGNKINIDNYIDVQTFNKGFAIVQREDGKWNFINKEGKAISDVWWKWCYDFSEGFAIVQREDRKWNFINKEGKVISNVWWKDCDYFSKGFASVFNDSDECNFINTKGELISNEWWDECGSFNEGFAPVRDFDLAWRFINTKGEVAFDTWWYWCYDFSEGFACVQREDGKWNFINKEGKVAFDTWWKDCYNFSEGFAIVQREDGKWNFINKEGKVAFDTWWKYCYDFKNGFARVRDENDTLYNIDKNGNKSIY